jgi:hypothetical protein
MNVRDCRFSHGEANLQARRGWLPEVEEQGGQRASVPQRQSAAVVRRSPRLVPGVVALVCALLLVACGGENPQEAPAGTTPAPTATTGTQATARVTTPAAATPTVRVSPSPTRTPRPVNTPTPLPPPVPAVGDSVQTNGWVLSVSEFETFARIGDQMAEGMYLYLRLTITNTTANPEAFPFEGLIVVDQTQETHFLDVAATRETLLYDFGFDMTQPVEPGETRQVAAAFDIPFDATDLRLTTPSRVFEIRLEYREAPK